MLTVNFVVDGTAADLLTSIAQNIKNDVERFFGILKKNGDYDHFKNLDPFAQRVEFFSESTDYKVYREALRQWILYGQITTWGGDWNLPDWGKKIDLIEAEAANRAGDVYALRRLDGSGFPAERCVTSIIRMRADLLAQNPILSDPNIDIDDRRRLMKLALRGNKYYQTCQKDFNKLIKSAVSSIITLLLLDKRDRSWIKDYESVVEGL